MQEGKPSEQIATRKKYWRQKFTRNVERDKEAKDTLTRERWLVIPLLGE